MTLWAFAYHLCRLIALSYNPRKFGASENQKNQMLPLHTAANGIRALLPSRSEWQSQNDRADKVYTFYTFWCEWEGLLLGICAWCASHRACWWWMSAQKLWQSVVLTKSTIWRMWELVHHQASSSVAACFSIWRNEGLLQAITASPKLTFVM